MPSMRVSLGLAMVVDQQRDLETEVAPRLGEQHVLHGLAADELDAGGGS